MTGSDDGIPDFDRSDQLLAQISISYHDQTDSNFILSQSLSNIQKYMNTITKCRNRKIGDEIGRKRKINMEFSENPYTKKGRQKIKNMTEMEKIIERAKNSDR
jgi:hypothetical protein